jgi:hypothetical protein
MDSPLAQCDRLRESLLACPRLSDRSPERDKLWLTVQAVVCTRHTARATPLGSTTAILVSAENATDELIAAMTWLYANEARARTLTAENLYKMLRGVATKGASGSARCRQSDLLHGLTHVSPGNPVRWAYLDPVDAAS